MFGFLKRLLRDDVGSLQALSPISNFEFDFLAFVERFVTLNLHF